VNSAARGAATNVSRQSETVSRVLRHAVALSVSPLSSKDAF
jgi:hypothetical protein